MIKSFLKRKYTVFHANIIHCDQTLMIIVQICRNVMLAHGYLWAPSYTPSDFRLRHSRERRWGQEGICSFFSEKDNFLWHAPPAWHHNSTPLVSKVHAGGVYQLYGFSFRAVRSWIKRQIFIQGCIWKKKMWRMN